VRPSDRQERAAVSSRCRSSSRLLPRSPDPSFVLLALVLPFPEQPKAPCTNELFELLPHGLTCERSYATPSKHSLCEIDEPGERIGARLIDQLEQARGFANSGPTPNVVNPVPSTRGPIGTG
jgi:hypothetical protein